MLDCTVNTLSSHLMRSAIICIPIHMGYLQLTKPQERHCARQYELACREAAQRKITVAGRTIRFAHSQLRRPAPEDAVCASRFLVAGSRLQVVAGTLMLPPAVRHRVKSRSVNS